VLYALGLIAVLSITVRLFSAGVRSYLPLYMVDRHGISPQLAGLVISLIAGSGIIGAPLGGALSDRYGRKRVILFSLSLSGPLLFAVTKLPYGIFLLIAMLLYGMTMSVRMPSMLSLIADVVPVGRRTTVLGVYFLIGEEVSGIATPVIGRLIDIYGIDPAFTGVAVGLCLLSAVALTFRKHI
jgi:MFS family permease